MPQIRFDWKQDRDSQLRRALRALEAGAVLVGVPDDVHGRLERASAEREIALEAFRSEDGWCLYREDVEHEIPLPDPVEA